MNIDRPNTEKYFADIEFEQNVAEIIRLQDEYQKKQQKKSDQLFNACITQSPDAHSIGSRHLDINDSDKYPPSKRTYNPRLSHKPAWVDSITTSLYSSMSSQPGLPSAESHSKRAAYDEDVPFNGRIITEELINKACGALNTIEQQQIKEDTKFESTPMPDTSLEFYWKDNASKRTRSIELYLNPRDLMTTAEFEATTPNQRNFVSIPAEQVDMASKRYSVDGLLTPEETFDVMADTPPKQQSRPSFTGSVSSTATLNTIHLTADDTQSHLDNYTVIADSIELDEVELHMLHKTLSKQLYVERIQHRKSQGQGPIETDCNIREQHQCHEERHKNDKRRQSRASCVVL